MMFLSALVSLFLAGVGYISYVAYRRRQLLSKSWDDVLADVQPVDLDGLRSIASCYLLTRRGSASDRAGRDVEDRRRARRDQPASGQRDYHA